MNSIEISGASRRIAQAANPEAPGEKLLGGPIELDGQNIGMAIRQVAEDRLLQAIVIEEQSEVGIITDNYLAQAGLGGRTLFSEAPAVPQACVPSGTAGAGNVASLVCSAWAVPGSNAQVFYCKYTPWACTGLST